MTKKDQPPGRYPMDFSSGLMGRERFATDREFNQYKSRCRKSQIELELVTLCAYAKAAGASKREITRALADVLARKL